MAQSILINDERFQGWDRNGKTGETRNLIFSQRPGFKILAVLTKASASLQLGTGSRLTPPATGTENPFDTPFVPVLSNRKDIAALLNGKKSTVRIDITNYVTEVQWDDATAQEHQTAKITLDNFGGVFSFLPIGTLILIRRRKPLWNSKGKLSTMLAVYVMEKDRTVSGDGTETLLLHCVDKLYWLGQSKMPKGKNYQKNKNHKSGWTALQAIRDIAHTAGVPMGDFNLGRSGKRGVRLKTVTTSELAFIDAIFAVLNEERLESGRKEDHIVHMRDGRLNVIVSSVILSIQAQKKQDKLWRFTDDTTIESGTVVESYGLQDGPATAAQTQAAATSATAGVATDLTTFATRVTVTANKMAPAKNKKHKKRNKLYQGQKFIITAAQLGAKYKETEAALGVINANITARKGLPMAQVRAEAKKKLLGYLTPNRVVTFQTRAIPGLWAGYFIVVHSRALGVKGVFKLDKVNYTLSQGSLTTELSFDAGSKYKLGKKGRLVNLGDGTLTQAQENKLFIQGQHGLSPGLAREVVTESPDNELFLKRLNGRPRY